MQTTESASDLPIAPPPVIGVGLLGCGVVGEGVARLLLDNERRYADHVGRRVVLRAVAVRDTARDRGLDPALLTSALEVVYHPEIQVVVEVMGGVHPARELILRAIQAGKHVVTANKEVLAKHGGEIFAAAHERGVEVYFEGSVGGGIPIILPLKRSLMANAITRVSGIINGTTNYILSQMSRHGTCFEDALKDAQRLGYAEADPAADVGGHDAANKLALLASIILAERLDVEEVYREGIEAITPKDLAYAHELGYAVKLLGIAKRLGDRLEVRVHPTMIPFGHPLARIDGVTNAITVTGDAVGEVTFSGPGAGRMPTASAVVSDVLNVAELIVSQARQNRLMDCHHASVRSPLPIGQIESAYYLRLTTDDVPGVLGSLGMLFAQEGVSIRSFVQKEVVDGQAELVFVTHAVREQSLMDALEHARALPSVRAVCNLIRVEEAPHGR